MTKRSGRGMESCCPRCGSSDVTELEVLEHPACGAVKPASAFSTDDDPVCPDCGDTPAHLELITRGDPLTCNDCGQHFTPKQDTSTDEVPGAGGTEATVLENVRSRLVATTSRHRSRVGKLQTVFVVLLLLSSASVVAVSEVPTRTEGTASAEQSWTHADAIVIFRNDDLQPHYRTETMREVDQVFVEKDIPVTQGVIPAGGGATLNPDEEFCQYLRSQAERYPETFEYAVHGYAHEQRTEFAGGSEFGGLPLAEQRTLIQEGTRALEACTGTQPTTFIPPMNTYDDATASAASETGYRVISGGGPLSKQHYNQTGPFEAEGILHLPSSQGLVKNWSTHELHNQSHLEAQFDAAYENESVYVQMIHYPTLDDPSDRAVLVDLIEYMQTHDNVTFMTTGEFATKYETGQLERTETGWRIQEAPDDGNDDFVADLADTSNDLWERATDHWQREVAA